ncbi:MAG TPA: CHAP domain-containing protein [Acidimicrobiales bacterium]|nr:CHAP domain-containing protein [Acidimicrobiales bacterium]
MPPRRGRRAKAFFLVLVVVAAAAGVAVVVHHLRQGPPLSPLQARIVSIAQSQVGYTTDPADTYCNKFSAYWYAGVDDCGNDNRDEEWCADFAAWVWKEAGAEVDYQLSPGYLNGNSASFYVWGVDHGTWHPVSSGYAPQPGDVAVYGLDTSAVTAVHVAVVTATTRDNRAPDVVNGDGDRTGYSVVETGTSQAFADVKGNGAPLSGYVSPSTSPSSVSPASSS